MINVCVEENQRSRENHTNHTEYNRMLSNSIIITNQIVTSGILFPSNSKSYLSTKTKLFISKFNLGIDNTTFYLYNLKKTLKIHLKSKGLFYIAT